MGFTLENVVPWGRSYDEYVRMFNLTEKELGLRILGCGDGPAAFNAELTKRGGRVLSVDPIYQFDAAAIRRRISDTYHTVMEQIQENRNDYVWNDISSVENLGEIRLSAMEEFLADFRVGKRDGRYIAAELPSLPLQSGQFDIALCSHFLFLYSTHLSSKFHIQAIQEMLRVAREVRIFPLLTLDGAMSPHLKAVYEYSSANSFHAKATRVPYEFQRGGDEMLVIKPA